MSKITEIIEHSLSACRAEVRDVYLSVVGDRILTHYSLSFSPTIIIQRVFRGYSVRSWTNEFRARAPRAVVTIQRYVDAIFPLKTMKKFLKLINCFHTTKDMPVATYVKHLSCLICVNISLM